MSGHDSFPPLPRFGGEGPGVRGGWFRKRWPLTPGPSPPKRGRGEHCPPTLSLADASRTEWGAVVVGAGPGGSLAAHELARRGVRVLLVDRVEFPRWKVCGCCVNGRALATLRAVGLGGLTERCGAVPLRDIRLAARGSEARLPLAGGVALSREVFDAALVASAVAAGAAFLPRTRAVLGAESACGRSIFLQQGGASAFVSAKVVLAADGLGGALLARAGFGPAAAVAGARIGAGIVVVEAPAFFRPGTVYMACGAGGYVGLVRLEDGRLNLAAALDADRVRAEGGPGAVATRLLAEAGWPASDGLARQDWKGTPALTRKAPRLAAGRVFSLGDAGGYVEPFTGEGMAWALAAGAAVAPVAARAVERWHPGLEREWSRRYAGVVGRRVVCRATAAVLRRPALVRAVVGVLSRVPSLARPVVYCLNRERRNLEESGTGRGTEKSLQVPVPDSASS